MQSRKLGPVLLCGLMIGPILGSGIFILPPLVLDLAGAWSLPAWITILLINAAFAFVFGWLSILFPGDGGVTTAVEAALGPRLKLLTAYYLIGSVCLGPAAVLLTIGHYLPLNFSASGAHGSALTALAILPVLCILLLQHIRAIGGIALVLSSAGALLLFAGGVLTLCQSGLPAQPLPSFEPAVFGRSLLLLFWIVVGWEVVGNYSGEVADPGRNIPLAVLLSVSVVSLVELAVAAGMQYGLHPQNAGPGVSRLLWPLLGTAGSYVGGLLVLGLCVTTYLLFVGAVSRLVLSLAEQKQLPAVFARRSKSGAPVTAILCFCGLHGATILLVIGGALDLAHIVALANGFFLANALIGVMAALHLFQSPRRRLLSGILAAALVCVLLQAEPISLVGIIVLFGWVFRLKRRSA